MTTADGFGRQFGNWPNRLHSCLTTWILIDIDNFFNNDNIMTSLLKKVINIYQNWCNQTLWSLVSFQIVKRILRHSSWASFELCSHRRRRRDKTVSSRRRCIGHKRLASASFSNEMCFYVLLTYLLNYTMVEKMSPSLLIAVTFSTVDEFS